jgi:HD superfamily phosphohydrolase YqeK
LINAQENKEKALSLLHCKELTDRGITALTAWLERDTDFFTAPCSTKFHLAEPGGLCEHSLNVTGCLLEKHAFYVGRGLKPYTKGTLILAGMLHDLAKIWMYKEGGEPAQGRQLTWATDLLGTYINRFSEEDRSALTALKIIGEESQPLAKEHASDIIGWLKDGYKPGTMPKMSVAWGVEDRLPMGHGEKSVYLAQKFITLTDEEALAIRWHMTAFDPSIHFDYPNGYAFRKAAEISPLVTLLFTADYEASNIIERKE